MVRFKLEIFIIIPVFTSELQKKKYYMWYKTQTFELFYSFNPII